MPSEDSYNPESHLSMSDLAVDTVPIPSMISLTTKQFRREPGSYWGGWVRTSVSVCFSSILADVRIFPRTIVPVAVRFTTKQEQVCGQCPGHPD